MEKSEGGLNWWFLGACESGSDRLECWREVGFWCCSGRLGSLALGFKVDGWCLKYGFDG